MGCHHEVKLEQEEHSALPSLHITMTSLQLDSILADRDNKVSAYTLLTDAQGDTLFEGNLAHIKTRGNSTFEKGKKPFTIKFQKKQRFFGLDRGKTFVLLANADDESHIRNAIALDLARTMGISAPRYAYLSLYINDTYWGLYQIANKIHVGKDALDITDLDKLNERANPKPLSAYEWYGLGKIKHVIQRQGVLIDYDPEDITGGYLLDNSGAQNPYQRCFSGFVSNAEDRIRIVSPKYASPREVDYIARFYNEMESAVMAPDGICHETGRYYSEYIDVESFARYYLLNELLLNWDGGWSSFMMYKDTDSKDPKLYAGPAWDYDRTLDNSYFQDAAVFPNELFVRERVGRSVFASSGGLLHHLCQHKDFQQTVRDCYLNEISAACHAYLDESPFDSLVSLLSYEADRDNEVYRSRRSIDYASAAKRATDFLRERIAFFDQYYSSMEKGHVQVSYVISNDWRSTRNRMVFCYPLGEPVNAPQLTKAVNNHDSVYALYDIETDSIIPDGTIFHTPRQLELRKREPTKHEMQMRRIQKKLSKLGFDF